MNAGLRALNRFGLGAGRNESRRLSDPRGWLREQLQPAGARMSDPDLPTLGEIGRLLEKSRRARRPRDEEALREVRRTFRDILARESSAALTRRIVSEVPYLERLVAFWSNHLCVSFRGKQPLLALAGHYERSVVRPHVLGRFEEMVLASARHPAMLLYLDNAQSIGPGSPASRRAARRGRERGLNENYARELLELHTVGVDGGYDQKDVEELARILTGWSIEGVGPRGGDSSAFGFAFRSVLHEPGDKKVMGKRYREAGLLEGEEVIRDLCRRSETARFVSGKLVRHFVADEPPATAVERLARVFSHSGGDLLQVSRALVDLEEAWDADHLKFRTPQDWIVAIFRGIGGREVPPRIVQVLGELRHPLWAPSSPKGYGDSSREWADPDSLMNRAELARSVSRVLAPRRLDPAWVLDAIDVAGGDPLRELLADGSIPRDERLALGIGGPAFQWR